MKARDGLNTYRFALRVRVLVGKWDMAFVGIIQDALRRKVTRGPYLWWDSEISAVLAGPHLTPSTATEFATTALAYKQPTLHPLSSRTVPDLGKLGEGEVTDTVHWQFLSSM